MLKRTHRIEVTPHALRQLHRLDPAARRPHPSRRRVAADHPRPSRAKRLTGGEGAWRVRTGDYRIVYEIHDQVLVVLGVAVGHLRDISRQR